MNRTTHDYFRHSLTSFGEINPFNQIDCWSAYVFRELRHVYTLLVSLYIATDAIRYQLARN